MFDELEIDFDLGTLIWELMGPLKEIGKYRQRNPNWKRLAKVCKMPVGNQTIDTQIITIANEVLNE